eukprot:SAG11_NODE_7297_length_1165_cov_1.080675_2_plen_100_part_00
MAILRVLTWNNIPGQYKYGKPYSLVDAWKDAYSGTFFACVAPLAGFWYVSFATANVLVRDVVEDVLHVSKALSSLPLRLASTTVASKTVLFFVWSVCLW